MDADQSLVTGVGVLMFGVSMFALVALDAFMDLNWNIVGVTVMSTCMAASSTWGAWYHTFRTSTASRDSEV